MKSTKIGLLFLPVIFCGLQWASCIRGGSEMSEPIAGQDLSSIIRRGKLVLLTESSSISYYLYQARPMGFDYELALAFADYLGVKLDVRVIPDLNEMFEMLNRGEGDIISCNLTISPERLENMAFSIPIDSTGAVLVQNKTVAPDSFITSVDQLGRVPITVHDFTVFRQLLEVISNDVEGLEVLPASGQSDTETIIREVAQGKIDATVVDDNVARLNLQYYPNLDMSLRLSESRPIGIAMRKNDHSLHEAINKWLELPETKRLILFLKKKYFDSPRDQKERYSSEFSSLTGGRISEYDETIKKAAAIIGWDWRLLAALIYHESRFNPEAHSYAGAFGLMQLMPETGAKFGIDTTQKTHANIIAGGKYIRFLDRFWSKHIKDKNERVKFVLASYNIGPGHILDAQNIAEHLCLSPDLWEDNVEQGLNLKSNKLYYDLETVKNGYCRGYSATDFVEKVLGTYAHFQIIKE